MKDVTSLFMVLLPSEYRNTAPLPAVGKNCLSLDHLKINVSKQINYTKLSFSVNILLLKGATLHQLSGISK